MGIYTYNWVPTHMNIWINTYGHIPLTYFHQVKKKLKAFSLGQEHKRHAGELQKDFILPPFKGTTEASKGTD